MARRVLPLIVLTLLPAVVLPAAACFKLDPRPPPPTSGAILAGNIIVASSAGASAANGDAVRRHRAEVARATAGTSAGHGMPDVIGRGAGRRTDERSSSDPVALRTSKMPFQWRAGDVLVLFEKRAYDKRSLANALKRMMRDADLGHVEARVVRCTAQLFCVVQLMAHGARVLDVDETKVAQLALDKHRAPRVQAVALNMKKWGLRVPNDPLFNLQWHYDAIGVQAAWEIEIGDPGLVIAVVDCGMKLAHPDLAERIARDPQNNTLLGADLISDSGIDIDEFAGRDTNPDDPGDGLFGAQGSSFHGTHIAGTIAAETDNNEGVAGITWQGKILPVRVLGQGLAGFDADIIDGLFWALGSTLVEGVPSNIAPARVVNLSLGGPSDAQSQSIWEAVGSEIFSDPDNLYDDPILVAAAGNSDEDASIITPANLPGMITAGAANIAGLRTTYSNYGSIIDVMAPGGEGGSDLNSDGQPDQILSTVATAYEFREGTSMAAPHVAGVAALLLSSNPALTQTTVESILKSSANAAGRCNEGCGAGLLDAVGALVLAGGEIQPEPLLATDVTQVFYPQGLTSRTFHVVNVGNAALTFDAVIEGPQAELFTLSDTSGTVPAVVDAAPPVALTVTLARGGFEAGSASVRITTSGLDPQQRADVQLDFNDDATRSPRQIETVQVAAYRRNAEGNLEQVGEALAEKGTGFGYEIVGLPAGTYEVFAVGDDNQDGRFVSEDESFGAWPTPDEPRPITIRDNQRVDGVDFAISSRFITDVVGGVGSPCDDANDCTFAADADCITTFAGGYCSRLCDSDPFCDSGRCALQLECLDDAGAPFFCNVCLARCASDAQCRFDEGYICDRGECVPESFRTEE
jgi:serine protease